MKEQKKKSLEKAIKAFPRGRVFSIREIRIPINNDAIRQGLKRLTDKGIIRRAKRGFFERPVFSKFLQETLETDMQKMAESLAKNNNWTIAPTGNTALNLLGLSTQTPATWTFVSDGPYKTYNINGKILKFKHRANKDISGISPKSNLVIQALKSLKQEETTPEAIEKIRKQLSPEEKKKILVESSFTTQRIYDSIKKICEG